MGQLTKQFGKIKVEVEIPHLLNLQVDSYRKFMQEGRTERLPDEGLEGVFRSVFPIEDFNRTASLEFVSYEVGEPKYDQAECISKGLTYESPVRIKVRLVVYDVDDETEARTVRDIKEQDIYFGTLPLMTEKGTFIINGTERVIVNQLQRSPGIIFEHDGGKTHTSRKVLYSCRVIPMRGSWLDFDFDHKDILYVRIDRRRKMPATILLKAMGMSKTEILDCFYKKEIYELEDDGRVSWHFNPELHRKEAAFADIVDKEGNVLVKAGKPITKRAWRQMEAAGVEKIEVAPETPLGLFLAEDLVDNATGEILAEAADEITAGLFDACREAGITTISALHTRGTDTSSSIRDTLVQDKTPTMEKAQEEIYRRLRPSSPPTPEIAASFFDNLFRNGDYYDLSPVGRRGRENKEQPAGCSALPPVPRRFFHSLPLPARRQPARTAKTENAPGHQYLQHPSEQPVAVTVCREGQSAVEQTGKPERKSDEPQSPAETPSECGADTGSENKRHAQGKKKNDKLTVHAHLSGRSRTFEEKRKESFLSGISRSHLGAPRQAPPHIYQGSLSFYGESPLLAKLRGGAVCRF